MKDKDEDWTTIMTRGIAAAGWGYAIMLTRNTYDMDLPIPWYEMLFFNVLAFVIVVPGTAWLYSRYRRSKEEHSQKADINP